MHFDTRAIHQPSVFKDPYGASVFPIYQTASYSHATAKELADVFQGKAYGHIYGRNSNPTVAAFETKVTDLHVGRGSVATATGMSAICAIACALARSGEEFVTSTSLFGGTYRLFEGVRDWGITPVYVRDPLDPATFESAITDKTRFVYVEAIGNPKIDIPHLAALSDMCKKHALPLILDATLVTPYWLDAKKLGVAVVVHSATKYMAIGGTTLGGVLTDTGVYDWQTFPSSVLDKFLQTVGQLAFLVRVRKQTISNVGATLSPMNAFLLNVGLETLSLRMEKHGSNAQVVASYLDQHASVESVCHPSLVFDDHHGRANEYYGGYGALISIRLGSEQKARGFIDALKLLLNQANIGGSKSLAIHPASTIYHDCSLEVRHQAGVYDDLIRLSIGLEHCEDIVADIDQALRGI